MMTHDERASYECGVCIGVALTAVVSLSGILGLILASFLPDFLALIIMVAVIIAASWAALRYCVAEHPGAGISVPEMPSVSRIADEADEPVEKVTENEVAADVPGDHGGPDYDGDGLDEGADEGSRPASLMVPMSGGADDLKRIKGIGPGLERMLNGMGYFHYSQIASWTKDEIAWVDANLEGFKGRVSRDNWVEQARDLADTGAS
ncbi:hypothetical protein [Abyssibius alkaniclasticus]|uniref:hypothetical protein n=1 Tax=Abyssibius alkaniclasticus TaxID=2881234 RepID=UPI004058F687|tara:strand:- start:35 stop:652 length:618 start_codon:yes stop_codon:yes gene_type:complete